MKDKVTKLEPPVVSGSVKIELTKDGIITKTIEKHNAITTNTQEWGRRLYKRMFSNYNHLNPTTHGSTNIELHRMMRFVHLLNVGYIAEDARLDGTEPIFPDSDLETIGYLDRTNETNSDDPKLGLINKEKSYATEDKAVFVYDWQPSKSVGTFNTIVHSADSNPNLTSIDSMNLSPVLVGGKPFKLDTSNGSYTHGFSIEGSYLYMVKEGSSSERRSGIRQIDMTTGFESIIQFDSSVIVSVDPVYVKVHTVEDTIYYYLADGNRYYWNVIIHDTSISGSAGWSYHNTSNGGVARYGEISFYNNEIYLYYQNIPANYQYGTLRLSLDLQTENGGMQQTYGNLYPDGRFYQQNSAQRTVLTTDNMPWDNTIAEREVHKYGDTGMDYTSVDGDTVYGREYVTWQPNNGRADGTTTTQILYKLNHTNGNLPYNSREGSIFKLDTPIDKSDAESMRITYTFNFE